MSHKGLKTITKYQKRLSSLNKPRLSNLITKPKRGKSYNKFSGEKGEGEESFDSSVEIDDVELLVDAPKQDINLVKSVNVKNINARKQPIPAFKVKVTKQSNLNTLIKPKPILSQALLPLPTPKPAKPSKEWELPFGIKLPETTNLDIQRVLIGTLRCNCLTRSLKKVVVISPFVVYMIFTILFSIDPYNRLYSYDDDDVIIADECKKETSIIVIYLITVNTCSLIYVLLTSIILYKSDKASSLPSLSLLPVNFDKDDDKVNLVVSKSPSPLQLPSSRLLLKLLTTTSIMLLSSTIAVIAFVDPCYDESELYGSSYNKLIISTLIATIIVLGLTACCKVESCLFRNLTLGS